MTEVDLGWATIAWSCRSKENKKNFRGKTQGRGRRKGEGEVWKQVCLCTRRIEKMWRKHNSSSRSSALTTVNHKRAKVHKQEMGRWVDEVERTWWARVLHLRKHSSCLNELLRLAWHFIQQKQNIAPWSARVVHVAVRQIKRAFQGHPRGQNSNPSTAQWPQSNKVQASTFHICGEPTSGWTCDNESYKSLLLNPQPQSS